MIAFQSLPTGSIKVSSALANCTSSKQQANQSASASSSSSGNAKYLRYVRSKLSKSRLNSVLSITSNASSAQQQQQQQQQQSKQDNSTLISQVNSSIQQSSCLLEAQDLESQKLFDGQEKTFKAELVRLEGQQQMVSSSTDVMLSKLSIASHKQLAGSLSNELTGELASSQAGKQQQSASKRSTFFQGFRYTLKGRRGSKMQAKQQADAADIQSSGAGEQECGLQQSHSLSSISSQNQPKLQAQASTKKKSKAAADTPTSADSKSGMGEESNSLSGEQANCASATKTTSNVAYLYTSTTTTTTSSSSKRLTSSLASFSRK